MSKFFLIPVFALGAAVAAGILQFQGEPPSEFFSSLRARSYVPAYTPVLQDSFDTALSLEETSRPALSRSNVWWVNSGAMLRAENGVGATVHGELPADSRWRSIYRATNAVDTDEGAHPQNIFRLVTRSTAKNLRQELYFLITRIHASESPRRNASNGVFLFNRYRNGDNLYYTGLRVDGGAVIKRKKNGVYSILAYKKIFSGSYERENNPSLLPSGTWLGIRSEVENTADGSVVVRLFFDEQRNGRWKKVLEVADKGEAAIREEGFAGIRTDFMDAVFDDYRLFLAH